MPRIPESERKEIIERLKSGLPARQIARNFSRSPQSVIKLRKKFLETHSILDRPKSGRPRVTTKRQDRILERISLKNRRFSAAQVRNEAFLQSKLSVRSVRRRLCQMGLFGRSAAKKPLVSRKNRLLRIQFAKAYLKWTVADWQRVIFTDESKFNRIQSDGRTYVRRRKGEMYSPNCLQHKIQGGGGSVMVWGCLSKFGTGPLAFIDGNLKSSNYQDMLENTFLPFYEENLPLNSIFQQDNAPAHRSHSVKGFLSKSLPYVLDWPAQSPDINIIENVWNHIKCNLKKTASKNLHELRLNVRSQWDSITPQFINKLFQSIPRRLVAILRAKGYTTKY